MCHAVPFVRDKKPISTVECFFLQSSKSSDWYLHKNTYLYLDLLDIFLLPCARVSLLQIRTEFACEHRSPFCFWVSPLWRARYLPSAWSQHKHQLRSNVDRVQSVSIDTAIFPYLQEFWICKTPGKHTVLWRRPLSFLAWEGLDCFYSR